MIDHDVVFLLDVDNTLLDTDRVTVDLRCFLEREIGHDGQQRYWSLFKQLRDELGYADNHGALQRYRVEYPHDLHSLMVSRSASATQCNGAFSIRPFSPARGLMPLGRIKTDRDEGI